MARINVQQAPPSSAIARQCYGLEGVVATRFNLVLAILFYEGGHYATRGRRTTYDPTSAQRKERAKMNDS